MYKSSKQATKKATFQGEETNTTKPKDNGTRPAWDRECAHETGVGSWVCQYCCCQSRVVGQCEVPVASSCKLTTNATESH